jgi:predicted nucleic acid-binding protein
MPDKRFFDTNVLIYAFSTDDPRSARAEALFAEGGVIGIQVLNEFTNVTRRKLRWQWQEIEAALATIEDLLGLRLEGAPEQSRRRTRQGLCRPLSRADQPPFGQFDTAGFPAKRALIHFS